MIEIKDLHKSFGDADVLKGVSMIFEKGKCNLIIGASGSGKSVLTKCIVGLHTPDSGQILYDGKSFYDLDYSEKREIRKQIGMLFQGSALFDSLTVEENVKFPLRMFTNMSEEELSDRANFCLSRVELLNKNDLFPAETSGGMQKRIGIARAIAMNPKYLFCDEPNSGLDPQTSSVIDNLIKEITEEYDITTLVITHDMNSVLEIGDNVSFIYQGEKAWQGNKETVLTTDNKEVVDFVYCSQFMRALRDTLNK